MTTTKKNIVTLENAISENPKPTKKIDESKTKAAVNKNQEHDGWEEDEQSNNVAFPSLGQSTTQSQNTAGTKKSEKKKQEKIGTWDDMKAQEPEKAPEPEKPKPTEPSKPTKTWKPVGSKDKPKAQAHVNVEAEFFPAIGEEVKEVPKPKTQPKTEFQQSQQQAKESPSKFTSGASQNRPQFSNKNPIAREPVVQTPQQSSPVVEKQAEQPKKDDAPSKFKFSGPVAFTTAKEKVHVQPVVAEQQPQPTTVSTSSPPQPVESSDADQKFKFGGPKSFQGGKSGDKKYAPLQMSEEELKRQEIEQKVEQELQIEREKNLQAELARKAAKLERENREKEKEKDKPATTEETQPKPSVPVIVADGQVPQRKAFVNKKKENSDQQVVSTNNTPAPHVHVKEEIKEEIKREITTTTNSTNGHNNNHHHQHNPLHRNENGGGEATKLVKRNFGGEKSKENGGERQKENGGERQKEHDTTKPEKKFRKEKVEKKEVVVEAPKDAQPVSREPIERVEILAPVVTTTGWGDGTLKKVNKHKTTDTTTSS